MEFIVSPKFLAAVDELEDDAACNKALTEVEVARAQEAARAKQRQNRAAAMLKLQEKKPHKAQHTEPDWGANNSRPYGNISKAKWVHTDDWQLVH